MKTSRRSTVVAALGCSLAFALCCGPVATASQRSWEKLASLQVGHKNPSEVLISRFKTSVQAIARICPNNPERVSDMLLVGHQQLPTGTLELVEFAEFVSNMLTTAEGSGGVPQMTSCSEPITLAVIALGAN